MPIRPRRASTNAQVRALVTDINIKRKAAYTKGAPQGSTVEQFAFATGCNLIAKTSPGEKYKAPDGRWLTRDSTPPVRDTRCPYTLRSEEASCRERGCQYV